MRSKILSLFITLFLASPLLAEETWDLTSVFLRIPQGQTNWSYTLPQSRFVSPYRITAIQDAYCRGVKFQSRVRYKGASEFSATTLKNDLFYTNDKAVDAIEVTLINSNIQIQECEINLKSLSPGAGTTPPPVPPQPTRAYAGLLEHSGGFANLKTLLLNSTYSAQDIEVGIPDYCQGYEIQELGYRLNGTFIPATRVRAKYLLFRLPKLSYFSSIELTILAPQGQSCQLPVYVYYQ